MNPMNVIVILAGILGTLIFAASAVIYMMVDLLGRAVNWGFKLFRAGTIHGYDIETMDNLPKHWLAKSILDSLFKRGRNRA